MSWVDGPLAAWDCESTDKIPTSARLVTSCGALIDCLNCPGPHVRSWIARADGFTVPDAAAEIHGWTTERCNAEGQPHRDVIGNIATWLRDAWAAGAPLVGMNHSTYDIALIQCELDRHGYPRLDVGPLIDVLTLDRRLDRFRKTKADGGRTLSNLCRTYGVRIEDAHTAEGDVLATLRVLWALVRKYPQLAEMNIDELQTFQAEGHAEFAEHMTEWLRSTDYPDHEGIDTAWPLVPEPVPMAFSA